MTAFVILDIEVTNPTEYEGYKQLAAPTVALYGGKYVVRGGQAENLEGDWEPKRIVVLQFESVERAKAWINSPEYAQARALRRKYAVSKAIVVEGA
jgi:uncharacterized protein (DUF1330 family)